MKQYKYLDIITVAFISILFLSNFVASGKFSQIGNFSFGSGIMFFPLSYLIGDVLTEVYGYTKARSVVWTVLLSSLLAGITYALVVALPPAVGFDANDAFTRVLGQIPRILVGGWIAVWIGGILNDYIMAKMKVWTNGKHLWSRTIGSTIVGEGANTILFYVIALYAVIPTGLLVASILSGWFLKVVVEVVMTPVTYKVVAKLKKVEGEDYYDTNTDFNPLIIRQ